MRYAVENDIFLSERNGSRSSPGAVATRRHIRLTQETDAHLQSLRLELYVDAGVAHI